MANITNTNFLQKDEFTTDPKYTLIADDIDNSAAYKKIFVGVEMYGSASTFLFGTIGNMLTILVMLRPNLRGHLISWLFIALAFSDSIALLSGPFVNWIRRIPPYYHDFSTLNWGCKVYEFIFFWSLHCSSWILIIITWERVVAVLFPVQSKLWITKQRGMVLLIVTILLLAVLNSHFLYINELGSVYMTEIDQLKIQCTHKMEVNYFRSYIWSTIHLSVSSIVPSVLLIIGNGSIMITIAKSKYEAKHSMNMQKSKLNLSSLTMMLMTTSFAFLLTTLPLCLYLAVIPFDLIWNATMKFRILNASLRYFSYLNNGINFWLYIISGRRFRTEFLAMIGIKKVDIQGREPH